MKWLILQSNGEHHGQDGWTANWFLRECFAWQDALLRLGHTADICGPRHAGFNASLSPHRFAALCDFYDVVLVAEQYDFTWLPNLALVQRARKVHWIVDLHIQGWPPYLPISRECHLVLHATQHLIEAYAAQAPNARHLWLPNAADDRYFRPAFGVHRNVNFQFIGGRNPDTERGDLLRTMENHTDLLVRYGVTGYDYIDALQHTKVGFNVPVNGDLNYRTFETIGAGACLVTKADPSLTALGFVHDENCLLYHTPEEAPLLYRYAMKHVRWSIIADSGHSLFRERHTVAHRVSAVLHALAQ